MGAFIEKWWPFAISVLLCYITIAYSGKYFESSKTVESLKENTVSICITLLGFFLTILTIIHALDNEAVRYIKEVGVMNRLYNYLKRAIQWNALATLISLIISFMNFDLMHSNAVLISHIVFLFSVFMALMTSVRFVFIFLALIKSE